MLARLLRRRSSLRFGVGKTTFGEAHALYEQNRLDDADRACAAIADAPRADVDFLRGLIARSVET